MAPGQLCFSHYFELQEVESWVSFGLCFNRVSATKRDGGPGCRGCVTGWCQGTERGPDKESWGLKTPVETGGGSMMVFLG